MRRFLYSLLALIALAMPAAAQVCPGASGFITQDGPVAVGNVAVFGPDCGHVQDNGIAGNSAVTSITGGYAAQVGDCGKTIVASGAAFYAVTVSAPTNFPNFCTIAFENADTGRGKTITVSGLTLPSTILYPLLNFYIKNINNSWVAFQFPERWKVTAVNTNFFIDSAIGLDSNDGLASGAGNALQSFTKFQNIVLRQLDLAGPLNIIANLNPAQVWTNLTLNGTVVGIGNIVIDAGGGSVTSANANAAIGLTGNRSSGNITIQNMVITNTNAGDGVDVFGGLVVGGVGLNYGAAGAHQINIANSAFWTAAADYTISGNAQVHVYADANSVIDNFLAHTVTCTNNPVFAIGFAVATMAGTVYMPGWSYSGCGGVTGPRYNATLNGIISTLNAGPNYFPGSVAGASLNGGKYDSPGTPLISACGTTPGAVTGGDVSGHVTEGTTATGCTITFSTVNTPSACSFNLSSGAAVGISSLSASQVTVTHASLSNNVLYWVCPALGSP